MLLLLSLILPAIAAGWIAWREFPRTWPAWQPHAVTIVLLTAAGWYAARPLLRGTWAGTGESYNYSLAVADSVTQFRAGHFPVFVGETEFAFNGRIHPLRTAPYYCYAAGALDLLTFRQLDFWQLQDLLLVLSIGGGGFAAYAALRYLVGVGRIAARFGAILYLLSSSVMAVTYAMDLYMTVTTLPFLPIAAGAAALLLREPSLRASLLLGAAMGAVWLAHPPIALWLSASVVVIEAAGGLTRRPTVQAAMNAAVGVVAGLGLAAYAFASTQTMRDSLITGGTIDNTAIFDSIRAFFRPALLPVSKSADKLGDFQLGYAFWLLLALAILVGLRRRRREVLIFAGVAALMLVFLVPIPGVMDALWNSLPVTVTMMTNVWPMQRLYLVATILILVAAGFAWREFEPRYESLPVTSRRAVNYAALAVLGWTAWQAQPFLNRGNELQRTRTASALVHRPENVDLTVTSYAMFALPLRFVHGVDDATREFRLLKADGTTEAANNWTPTAAAPGPVRARGVLNVVNGTAGELPLSGLIRLQPGRRYALEFDFQVPPLNGTLLIEGEHFFRRYFLPSAGERRAFGMQPGNSHTLVLWTTNPPGEELKMRIVVPPGNRAAIRTFANYVLYEIDPASYPVQVDEWSPLQGRVTAPEEGWLETPRRLLPGYTAAVDGQPAELRASPEGLAMLKVPAGAHRFEVTYPGPALLRASFWLSLCSLAGLVAAGIYWLMQNGRGIKAPGERPTPNAQHPTPNVG